MNFQNNAITQALVVSLCITYGIDAAWGRAAARFLTPAMAIGAARYSVGMDSAFAQTGPSSVSAATNTAPVSDAKSTSATDDITRYFSQLNAVLSSIPKEKAVEALMKEQQYRMLRELLQPDVSGSAQEDGAAPNWQSKEPYEWPKIDTTKSAVDRVESKFMGTLPIPIKDAISYLEARQVRKDVPLYPNRLLLYGDPGLGKTYLSQLLAQELGISFLSFSAASFMSKYMGEGAQRMRRAFSEASALQKKHNKAVLVFIDEIDTIAAQRKDATHQEYRAILTTLLTELENYKDDPNVFFVVATNDLSSLDAAVKNRFAGTKCKLERLDEKGRKKFFRQKFTDAGLTMDETVIAAIAQNAVHKGWVKNGAFSTRELEIIFKKMCFKQFDACRKNPSECSKPLSDYVATAVAEVVASHADEQPKTTGNSN